MAQPIGDASKATVTPETRKRAQELRKEPTPAESKLWAYLRKRHFGGVKFRRQHPIGPYITDFCSLSHRLVIEVDGSGHLDTLEYDAQRTAYLESCGYRVLRFWNQQVLNEIEGVLREIEREINPTNPTLGPSPSKGRGRGGDRGEVGQG